MKSGDVVNRTGQGPIAAPPVFGEWEKLQREADRDDPYKNIPSAEVKQPQSTSVTYAEPAVSAAPIVPETPLLAAARNVEVTKAEHEAAKVALEQARAACEAAQHKVNDTLAAAAFAKKELKDLVAQSIGD